MKFNFRWLPASMVYLSFMLSAFSGEAQDESKALEKKRVDSVLGAEQLERLPGDPQTYYHTGYTVRAKTLQALVRDCVAFAARQWPGMEFGFRLFVLNKEDWERPGFDIPYGIPFYNPTTGVMAIAVEKNALAHLNHTPDDPVTADSIASGFDFISLHELGHYFFFTQHHLRKEHWANEFLASYFFLCYNDFKKLDPALAEHMQPHGQPAHRTLEDFEKYYLKVGPPNYDWYQRQFVQLGIALYPRLKTTLIDQVLANFAPRGKNLDMLSLLKTLAPDLVEAWLRGMQ